MIRLTPVEKEVLIAVNMLISENPKLDYFTTEQIFERRMQVRGGRSSGNLQRTTREFLERLACRVPALIEKQEECWGLLAAGRAVFNTQLRRELQNGST